MGDIKRLFESANTLKVNTKNHFEVNNLRFIMMSNIKLTANKAMFFTAI